VVLRHSFDPATLFCTGCGKSASWLLDRDEMCRDDVLAISHVLARKNGTRNIERLELQNAENKTCTERRITSL